MSDHATIEDRIFHCWHAGNSIGETRDVVRRASGGTDPGFDPVRRRFAEFSHQYARVAA